MSSTTCVIVDDHPVIARAVESAFAGSGVDVVGWAQAVPDALELLGRLRPDVALVDLRLRSDDGLELVRLLGGVSPRTRAVVFTGLCDRATLLRALDLGAAGFLLKEAPLDELVHAVTVAAAGGTYVDPALAREVVGVPAPQLTEREWDILRLLAEGLGNREIGEALLISPATVRTHLRNAMDKLGASTRAQAVAVAFAAGGRPVA
jgi:DNA-binding NarL/FixJ family response regulator